MSSHTNSFLQDAEELSGEINVAVLHPSHIDRVHYGLSVLDQAMLQIGRANGDELINCEIETVDLDADDLFDIVSIVMDLEDPAARKVGLTGLVNALRAPDLEALQISCLAVQRFCGFVSSPSHARH
ncbi:MULTISPECIES: hypothetical protein [unclassified Brevundimonas]|uniref:hypothetical protein n=1 Tax=unclassified Brevundimonas TaxID=2622653 RepID=UPI0025C659A1|nr:MULTISPECIES: hypothetical protein [unclassified Brevundimonas]